MNSLLSSNAEIVSESYIETLYKETTGTTVSVVAQFVLQSDNLENTSVYFIAFQGYIFIIFI